MKQNFYIFLDIDGVLNDWKYLQNYFDKHPDEKGGTIARFNPTSIFALNYLIEKLEKDYDVKLVISSTWRNDMSEITNTLKCQNLKYNKKIDAIGFNFDPFFRGKEILKYLEDKPNNNNFVVIDDELFDYEDCFSKDKIIKTEIYSNSLNLKQVVNFLKKLKSKEIIK